MDITKLPKPCIECPFRWTSEGGRLSVTPYTGCDVVHPFPERQFQPCHMTPETGVDCRGNIRNDILVANNGSNGDEIRLTRDVTGTDENGVVRLSQTLQPIRKPLAQIEQELSRLRMPNVQSESGS